MASSNSVNLFSENFTLSGDWSFEGTFNVQVPSTTFVKISNLLTDPFTPVAGRIVIAAENELFLGSFTNNITLSPQVGDVVLNSGTGGVCSINSGNGISLDCPVINMPQLDAGTADHVLYFDSTTQTVTHAAPAGGGGGVASVNVVTFFTNGTYTAPGNLLYAKVEVVGGGGGGGGADGNGAGVSAGCGGSGGTYSMSILSAATIGASQTVTIGAGGPGGTGSASGSLGGISSFGSLVTAPGGQGGQGQANTTIFAKQATARSFGGTGQITITGSGGEGSFGQSSLALSGSGGSSHFGSGGTAIPTVSAGADGNQGSGYGSGGSGAANSDNTTFLWTGGAGQAGVVVITEYRS